MCWLFKHNQRCSKNFRPLPKAKSAASPQDKMTDQYSARVKKFYCLSTIKENHPPF